MRSRLIRIIVINVLFIISFAYCQTDEFNEYLQDLVKKFNVKQVKIDSLNLKDVILLDTREFEEYKVSHIRSAIHVGYRDFSLERVDTLQKDINLVVYCSVGYRSSEIAEQLQNAGFKNVKNLYGGIFTWANSGRELVDDSSSTREIHVFDQYWGRFINNNDLIKVK